MPIVFGLVALLFLNPNNVAVHLLLHAQAIFQSSLCNNSSTVVVCYWSTSMLAIGWRRQSVTASLFTGQGSTNVRQVNAPCFRRRPSILELPRVPAPCRLHGLVESAERAEVNPTFLRAWQKAVVDRHSCWVSRRSRR